ncbi:MAG: hypothetical protein J6D27_03230 [Ruminiclostridium sp.]|nr:hypothetical protein [Ruminiclostridium sp.]
MKELHDIIASAIDYLDEEYSVEAADCFPLKKSGTLRQSFVNAEDLVEMKIKSKKSGFIAKIVAVAAAFVCVATVSVFLIVNNNKVQVLGNMESVLSGAEESSNESYTHPRDENNNYGYSIGYCGDIPTEYNGKELTLDIEMSNQGQEIKYAYFVYVNGIITEYKTSENGEKALFHRFSNEENASKTTRLYFTPVNCKKGEKATICVALMIKPDFMLPDTSYVKFIPNHNITSIMPLEIAINVDSPTDEKAEIADCMEKTPVTKEFEAEFATPQPDDKDNNMLDHQTIFQLYQDDPMESYLKGDDITTAKIRAMGQPGKYILSLYVNHEMVPCFDGKYYTICDVERENITEYTVQFDSSNLPSLNHIYIMAIPYVKDGISWPHKTATKLLSLGEEDKTETTTESVPSVPKTDEPSENAEMIVTRGTPEKIISGGNGKLYLQYSNSFALYSESNGKETSLVSRKATENLIPMKNGFAVYDRDGSYMKMYDNSGKLLNEHNFSIPEGLYHNKFAISGNETEILFAYTDNSNRISRLVVYDVHTLEERVVTEFTTIGEDVLKSGNIVSISDIYGADKNTATLSVIRIKDYVDGDVETEEVIMTIDLQSGEYVLHEFEDKYEASNSNFQTYQKNYLVLINQSPSNPYHEFDGIIRYKGYADKSFSEFKCETGNETCVAALSENGKYLATYDDNAITGEVTIRVYDVESGKTIYTTDKHSYDFSSMQIDEQTRTIYIVSPRNWSIYVYRF